MLPLESLRMMRKADLAVVSVLAALLAISISLLSASMYLIIVAVAMSLSFAALLLRRTGAPSLIAVEAAIFLAMAGEAPFGPVTIAITGGSGIAFEAVFAIARMLIKSQPFDLLISAGLTGSAAIWAIHAIALKGSQLSPVVNASITAFFTGIAGALIACAVWYEIKNSRVVIRFEYRT